MPKPSRVSTAAEKLRMVKEADRCATSGKTGAVEAMLRREGLYSSLLSRWRTQFGAYGSEGLALKKRGRKPKYTETERRNAELMKRNAELERKLCRQRSHRSPKKSARASGAGTARERRGQLMDLVEDLAEPEVSVVATCAELGVSRATLYRTTSPTRLGLGIPEGSL